MSLIDSQQIIHVNSKFRVRGTDDNFDYKIQLNSGNLYTHVAVLSVSIPKSYYLVPEGENTFVVMDDGTEITVTIPPGNYSITSFIYVLTNIFQNHAEHLNHYSVTFPNSKIQAQTGKMTFVHTNTNHSSSFVFGDNHLAEVMGFERGSTNTFVINGNQTTLVSKNVCNFQRESTLFLHSDVASNEKDDILLEMFASGNPDLSNINFENQGNLEEHSKLITNSQNNSYKFYITDEYDKGINLNGVNMLITLCFYQKTNVNRLIRGFIKYKMLLDRENEK
jgi:hypothetical protein